MSDEKELKPCPFCGGSEIETQHDDGRHWDKCLTCFAEGPPLSKYFGSDFEAVYEWNTRPIEDNLQSQLTAARERIEALESHNYRLLESSDKKGVEILELMVENDKLRERLAALNEDKKIARYSR